MKNKLQKFLSLLLVLCAAITISAGNIAQGSFKKGGTWTISEGGELYIDVKNVPDYRNNDAYNEGYRPSIAVGNRLMFVYAKNSAPWGKYKEKIVSI